MDIEKYKGRPKTLAAVAALLKEYGPQAAILGIEDLQAFWLSLMADRNAPVSSRLVASKYYADSIGAFSLGKSGVQGGPIRVRFADESEPVAEAEVVEDGNT